MPKALVIVESPTKAKAITKFLGKDYEVVASGGHVMDLPKSKLGVDIDNGFAPDYRAIRGKGKVLKEMRTRARRLGTVYLAPDPDREGEAIAWHLKQQIGNGKVAFRRLAFYEVTKKAVQSALEDSRDVDMNMVDAQQARRVMDRLVGYQVSPLLWKTIRYGLSAGRVQTVALRMIVEREKEIRAFVPVEYWSITCLFATTAGETFVAKLVKVEGENPEIPDEAAATAIVARIESGEARVATVARKEKRRRPNAPFMTSTLQQEAFQRLRFSAKKTMMVAQQLYEGINLPDEGTVGLISYMRTDSTRINADALAAVRDWIGTQCGDRYLPESPNLYTRRGQKTQDAHEAIRPTDVGRLPDRIARSLSADQLKLYRLIWNRFVASQMTPAVYDVTTIEVAIDGLTLRATGSIEKFDGFLKIYGRPARKKDASGSDDDADTNLPEVNEGDRLENRETNPKQHFTEPPPRYTEATLVKALEANGIGRPSTYATIMSTIMTRDYVQKERGALRASDLGITVIDLLLENFPDVFEIEFTARMEGELDRVESGDDEWVRVVRDFYTPFSTDLKRAEDRMAELRKSVQVESDIVCDQCGQKMVKKFGRNGPFLACPGYPECKNTRPLEGEEPPQETGEVCDKCGQPMVVKIGRFGRFLACSGYPECKNTASIKVGVACPEEGCSGQIVEKRSRRGKMFYGCDRYPDCTFALWQRPVARACPECGHPFMVYKETKARGPHLYCTSCKGTADLEESDEASAATG
ncbi:MAG: type I DNA topoisomerase [Candidatus Eiseniibacteriota bacterium]|jgi:DNA topoisomerase-1